MRSRDEALQSRLKLSGILVSPGLLIEALTLNGSHPLTFLAFIMIGGVLVGSGVALYLCPIVSC